MSRLIEALPGIPSPNGKTYAGPELALSPLIAAIDPISHFPLVNGQSSVRDLLRALNLNTGSLERQVKGLLNVIEQGVGDAFMLDVLSDVLATNAPKLKPSPHKAKELKISEGASLPQLDDAERIATIKSETVRYRNRHRTMTNRLQELFGHQGLDWGVKHAFLYEALLKDYDGAGRDLLFEVKPDPTPGAIRIAVGQLLDYRRHLKNRFATDMALVTIEPPSVSYRRFLSDLQISCLWFTDTTCSKLTGEGNSWSTIKTLI